jgi:hypothetical protein
MFISSGMIGGFTFSGGQMLYAAGFQGINQLSLPGFLV